MRTFVIDGEMLCESSMNGMHRYMHEIIKRLDNLISNEDDVRILIRNNRELKNLDLKKIKVVKLNAGKYAFRLWAVPKYVRSNNAVYISMSNNYTACKNSIITLHDMIPMHIKNEYSFKSNIHMKLIYKSIRRNAKRIVTISEWSKNEIHKYLNIELDRICITGTGYEHIREVSEDRSIFERYKQLIPGEYYLSQGNRYSYKNMEWICKNAIANPEALYVITGENNNELLNKYSKLSNVLFTGFITDEEYKALLTSCKAFIFPSRLEGFGIPPLEAAACGRPIIVADSSALKEIYKDSAVFINENNPEINIDEAVAETPKCGYEELLGRQSWDKMADAWMGIIREY